MSEAKNKKRAVMGPSKRDAIFAITEQIQKQGTMYKRLPAEVLNRPRDFSELSAISKPLNDLPQEHGNLNSRTYGL